MTTYLFGIITGIFLTFGGSKFFVFATKALKDRKEKEIQKTKEDMKAIIEKVMGEVQKEKGK